MTVSYQVTGSDTVLPTTFGQTNNDGIAVGTISLANVGTDTVTFFVNQSDNVNTGAGAPPAPAPQLGRTRMSRRTPTWSP